jgi:DNA repair ATPase RecN
MDEILMEVLNETLEEVTKRMTDVKASIEGAQRDLDGAQEAAKGLEKVQKCKTYEDDRVKQKMETLRMYLNRFDSEKRPLALIEKMEKLTAERGRTYEASFQAGRKVSGAHDGLKERRNHLGMLRQEHAQLQQQWDEMAELITQE